MKRFLFVSAVLLALLVFQSVRRDGSLPVAFSEVSASSHGPTHGILPVVMKQKAMPRLQGVSRLRVLPEIWPVGVLEPSQAGKWRTFDVSAYSRGCECPHPVRKAGKIIRCGKQAPQPTKSGVWPEPNFSVAVSRDDFPIGAVLELSYAGILTTRVAHDIGEDITSGRLDLYMSDCRRANDWGHHPVSVREIRRPLGSFGK